jgi:hypothetical protein
MSVVNSLKWASSGWDLCTDPREKSFSGTRTMRPSTPGSRQGSQSHGPPWLFAACGKSLPVDNSIKKIYFEWDLRTDPYEKSFSGTRTTRPSILIGHRFNVLQRSLESWIQMKTLIAYAKSLTVVNVSKRIYSKRGSRIDPYEKSFSVAHTTQPLLSQVYTLDSGRESFPQGYLQLEYPPFGIVGSWNHVLDHKI